MSPDIEWRVGETDDQEIIVRIKTPPPRWRKLALLAVVLLGLGLGVVYASMSEPAGPPPTPTPPPAPTALPRPTAPPVLSASAAANSPEATIDQ